MTTWLLGLALVSQALAIPDRSGAIHPGARPAEAGDGYFGIGAGAGWAMPVTGMAAAGLELGVHPSDRVGLGVSVGRGMTLLGPSNTGMAHVRWLAFADEGLRVAPWLAVSASFLPPAWGGEAATQLTVAPGIALEAGSDRRWMDLSTSTVGLVTYNQYAAARAFPLYGTIGMNWAVGEVHRFRLGVPELISYHLQTGPVYFDFSAFTVLFAGVGQIRFGGRF